MNLLYIEDNTFDAELTQKSLESARPDYQVYLVGSLQEAYRFLKDPNKPEPDLILVDLVLPDGSGLEVFNFLRSVGISSAVVVVTGRGDVETAVSAIKAGADDYIVKNLSYQGKLPETLDRALARHKEIVNPQTRILQVFYAEPEKTDIELTLEYFGKKMPHIQFDIAEEQSEIEQILSSDFRSQYDVIVLNDQIPEVDTIKIVKELFESGMDVPVIILANDGSESNAVQAFQYQVSDFLEKHPGYLFRLPGIIENAANSWSLAQERLALKESEDRFRRIAENAPDIIFRIELMPERKFSYISPAVEAITGFAPQDHYSNPDIWEQLIYEEESSWYKNLITGEINQLHPESIIWRDKEGKLIWTEHRYVPVYGSNGRLIAIEGIIRDITDRKNTERTQKSLYMIAKAAITASSLEDLFAEIHSSLRGLLFAENFYIAILDQVNQVLIFPYFVDQKDPSPGRVPIGRNLTSYVVRHGKSLLASPEVHNNLVESGEVELHGTDSLDWLGVPLLIGNRVIGAMVVQSYSPDIRYSTKDLDVMNFVSAQVAMAIERKFSDKALHESERRLSNLMQNLPGLAYRCKNDSQWTMEFVSEGCYHLTGYKPVDLVGNKKIAYASLIHEDDREMVWKRVQSAVDSRKPFELSYRIITKDRQERWVREQGNAVYNREGEVDAIEGFISDIDEQITAINTLQRQFKELSILNSIAIAGAKAVSEEELLEFVTQTIGEMLYPDNFGILLFDEISNKLYPHPSYRGVDKNIAPGEIPLHRGVVGKVVSTGSPIRIPDVSKEPDYIEVTPNSKSELCVPIKIGDHVLGVINAESAEIDFFSQEDENLLTTIAGQVGISLEKIRLFASEKRRRQESDTLRQAATTISSTIELREVLENIQLALKEVIPFDSSAVFLLENNVLIQTSVYGFSDAESMIGQTYPADSSLFSEIKSTGRPVILKNAHEDPRFNRWGGTDYVRGWMGIPLIWHGEVFGHITIDNRNSDVYTPEDAALAQAFAYQAAAAIQNARLYEEAISSADRRAVLHRASQEIARASQDIERVYSAVHTAAAKLMPAEAFVIILRDEEHNELIAVYLHDDGVRHPQQSIDPNQGLASQVVSSGKPVMIDDISRQEFYQPIRFGSSNEVVSILAVPLRLGEKTIGMLSCQSLKPNAYNNEDVRLLEMLAAHAAAAIENARLYAETRQRLNEVEVVNHISSVLRAAQKPGEILPDLLDETLSALGTNVGAIWLYDGQNEELLRVAARGWMAELPVARLKPGEGIAGQTYSSGRMITTEDINQDPRMVPRNRTSSPPGWNGICVPIQTTHDTIGVFFVAVKTPQIISSSASRMIETISQIAGNSLQRSMLNERTEEQLRRLTALRDVDTAITSSFDLNVTLDILLGHAIHVLRVEAADILLYNPYQQVLNFGAGRGFRTSAISRSQLRMGEGIAGRSAIERKTIYIKDLQDQGSSFARQWLLREEDFRSYAVTPLIVKGQIKGVLETFSSRAWDFSFDWQSFFETLAGQAAIAIDNTQLFEHLQRSNQELALAYDTTLEGWGKALELRDKETQGHTKRVTLHTMRLAREMGISDVEMTNIRRGVLLHDIGKMGVPDQILHKPGPLDENEWEIMRQHPKYAYELLSSIEYLRPALVIPYYHHEKWDGSGYPFGLKGEAIPLAARIFAIVDVYDALISDRPYRPAWSPEKALQYVREQSGKHFDPKVVKNFIKVLEEFDFSTPAD